MAAKMGTLLAVTNTTRVMPSEAEAYLAAHVQDHESGAEFPMLFTVDELYNKSHLVNLPADFVNEMTTGHVYVISTKTPKCTRNSRLVQVAGHGAKASKVVVAMSESIYKRAKIRATTKASIIPKKSFFGNLVD
jgi:hypothetical protein